MTNRLNALNDLLVLDGKKPLKAWKGSKATLETRIETMTNALSARGIDPTMTPPENEINATPASIMSNVADEIAKGRAKVARKGAAKAKQTKAIKEATMYTLADLARAAGVNPKVARAKLRRHAKTEKWLARDTWTFGAAEKKKVEELLAGTK